MPAMPIPLSSTLLNLPASSSQVAAVDKEKVAAGTGATAAAPAATVPGRRTAAGTEAATAATAKAKKPSGRLDFW